jgi:hypothetical protein
MQIQIFKGSIFNEKRAKYWFLIKLIFLAAAIFICGSIDAPAQNKRTNKRTTNKTVAKTVQPKSEKTDTSINNSNFPSASSIRRKPIIYRARRALRSIRNSRLWFGSDLPKTRFQSLSFRLLTAFITFTKAIRNSFPFFNRRRRNLTVQSRFIRAKDSL